MMLQHMRTRQGAVVLMATTALTLGSSTNASASQATHREVQQTVAVVGDGSHVKVDHSRIQTGFIRFKVSTSNPTVMGNGGSNISLFQPKRGKTLANVFADLHEEFSPAPATAAKGTRDLVRDVSIFGLADVVMGFPEIVTEHVAPGTYYLFDLGNQPKGDPAVTSLTVGRDRHAFEQDSDLSSQTQVKVTSADRFIAPRFWPHRGTYTFTNIADTIHFMGIVPVKDGTTDAQVQAVFSAPPSTQTGPPPFFRPGPSGGNDVVSPGRSLQVSYNLPRGTYLLVCFVSDDKTGLPHAIMGMHKVIHLT